MDEAEELADRVAVIKDGKIIEVASPKTLGGRDHAMTEVSFIQNGVRETISTETPTAEIARLERELGGEIPELTVKRSTLEEIYIRMIEASQ